eukprot:529071-Pleurochrysis_carterae.AAC.2
MNLVLREMKKIIAAPYSLLPRIYGAASASPLHVASPHFLAQFTTFAAHSTCPAHSSFPAHSPFLRKLSLPASTHQSASSSSADTYPGMLSLSPLSYGPEPLGLGTPSRDLSHGPSRLSAAR